MSSLLAVYAGSFDPVTLGHLDLIERSGRLFGEVVVAVGRHATKKALLLLRRARRPAPRGDAATSPTCASTSFDGLLIHFCERIGARVIVRGLRAATDFEYELQIAHANADMVPAHRHHLPADAHQLRLRLRLARARDRQPRRRREPLRAAAGLRGAGSQVRGDQAGG